MSDDGDSMRMILLTAGAGAGAQSWTIKKWFGFGLK